jgi:hypothetical protein
MVRVNEAVEKAIFFVFSKQKPTMPSLPAPRPKTDDTRPTTSRTPKLNERNRINRSPSTTPNKPLVARPGPAPQQEEVQEPAVEAQQEEQPASSGISTWMVLVGAAVLAYLLSLLFQ